MKVKITKENIREYLPKLIPNSSFSKNTGWLACKCPFCDNKSDTKRHMSICLIPGGHMIYRCWRDSCQVKGVLNRDIGRRFLLDGEICNILEEEASRYVKYPHTTIYYARVGNFKLGKIDAVVDQYFKDRTGFNLNEVQEELRIVTDLNHFVKINKIEDKSNVYPLLLQEQNGAKFIYFFNDTFTSIGYRQVNGKLKGFVSLFKTDPKSRKKHLPYILGREYEKQPNRESLYLAEGQFDIINTYLTIFKDKPGAFIATGGMAKLRNIVVQFIKTHYRPRITILSDSDVKLSIYNKLLKQIDSRISELVILYNTKYKDVGEIEKGYNFKKVILKEYNQKIENMKNTSP